MKLKYIGKYELIMTEFKGGKLVKPQEIIELTNEEYTSIINIHGTYLHPIEEKVK
jgi:hypothetical protein